MRTHLPLHFGKKYCIDLDFTALSYGYGLADSLKARRVFTVRQQQNDPFHLRAGINSGKIEAAAFVTIC